MPSPLNGIFLRDGPITVGIAPGCGGALTRFDVRTRDTVADILRPALPPDAALPPDPSLPPDPATRCSLGASCFPLVPYGGRLREGRFEFEQRLYRFPLNALPERHSSHGDGWSRAWALSHLDRRRAIMSLEADESAPFQYHCTQSVSIAGDRVSIELSARNLSAQRIPMGFGLHPYFANRSDARIEAELPTLWRWDHEMMPVSKEPNPDAASFSLGHRISELPVAAEYADWDGGATIEWPTMRLRVELQTHPPLKHVVMWMPAGKDFFCFEPVSHATDALNGRFTQGPGEDFFVLEPGTSAEQRFDFIVSSGDSYSS